MHDSDNLDPQLKRLLALKRAERPHDTFFEGVVPEFHRRLRAEQLRAERYSLRGVWTRFVDAFTIDPTPVLRGFGLSSGAVAAVAVALVALRPAGPGTMSTPDGLAAVTAPTPAVSALPPSSLIAEPQPALPATITMASMRSGEDADVFMRPPQLPQVRQLGFNDRGNEAGGEVVPVSFDESGVAF